MPESENDLNLIHTSLKDSAKRIIWQLQGYFQFKSENSEVAEKAMKMLEHLLRIMKDL